MTVICYHYISLYGRNSSKLSTVKGFGPLLLVMGLYD